MGLIKFFYDEFLTAIPPATLNFTEKKTIFLDVLSHLIYSCHLLQ